MDLNDFILSLSREETPLHETLDFFTGLKKLAALLEEEAAAEAPPEGESPPPVEEAVVRGENAEPDTMGVLEGEFAAPVEDVINSMVNLVGIEMKLQLAYLYYAEMVRGPGRHELAEFFLELAKDEAEDASYLLRRIAVLTSGQGVAMPPIPSPQPFSDRESILKQLIAYEQQAIVFLKVLRQQLGENPMKFTVEEMLSEEQSHIDKLWQHMPEAPKTKVAAAMRQLKLAAADVAAGVQALPAAPEVVVQHQQAELAQLMAEREHLLATAQHLEGVAHQNAAAAESAGAEAQQAQQQAQAVQQQAQEAQMQAQQATEQAAASEENAAQQAEAKMRLAMRIQQFRQQMADMASTDPVAEEGLGFGEQAGAGSPMTQTQQMQQEQAAAEEQQAQVEQAAAVDPETRKQQMEAERAQDQAAQQQEQVQHAASKVSSLLRKHAGGVR